MVVPLGGGCLERGGGFQRGLTHSRPCDEGRMRKKPCSPEGGAFRVEWEANVNAKLGGQRQKPWSPSSSGFFLCVPVAHACNPKLWRKGATLRRREIWQEACLGRMWHLLPALLPAKSTHPFCTYASQ